MMNELSVIIAFRNESVEIEQTILEIKCTVGNAVDIILVNDASEDGYNYKDIADQYKAIYIENSERKGCAASREIGISVCATPYFFIIDGHMRFYDNDWHHIIVAAIKENPGSIYCCKCRPWDYATKTETNASVGYGAYLQLHDSIKNQVMEVKWISRDFHPQSDIVEIPCVLGACYAASKEYWNYLWGLRGLRLYGCDEAYISIKAWMEGGGCRLLKRMTVGHLFREQAPYALSHHEVHYNKSFMAATVLPDELGDNICKKLYQNIGYVDTERIKRKLDSDEIREYKQYYSSVLTAGFANFERINNQFKAQLNIK
jgi:glycosyltransferase involved in cell wall biosynthesis